MDTDIFDPTTVYRYDSLSGTIFIDLQLDFYRELYNEWDFSPLINRDLDEDLLKYLETCCEEIPAHYRLVICFSIPKAVYDIEKERRASEGIRNFFRYLLRYHRRRHTRMNGRMLFVLFLGVSMISITSLVNYIGGDEFIRGLAYEGLMVGGWVAFWEFFSMLFFRFSEHREKIRVYQRLLEAEIEYTYRD